MTPHQLRLLTSFILLPFLALLIVLGPPLAWVAVLAGVSLLGLWEFYSLFWPGHNSRVKLLGLLPGVLIPVCGYFDLGPAAVLVLGFWGLNLFFLLPEKNQKPGNWSELAVLPAGWLYVPVVLHWVLFLQRIELVLILLVTVVSDSGAYYCGRLFGKKKIWPKISPNKTWAGAFGGLLACVPVCVLLGVFWGKAAWYHWLWIPVVLNLGAQFGDFFESGLKRQLRVKDSGGLLPGHGGLLDRIDSLLLVLPVYMGIRFVVPLF